MEGALIEALCILEVILWVWGVLRVPITISKKRMFLTMVLIVFYLLWKGIYGFGENAAPIEMGIDSIFVLLLFSEKPAVLFVKYFFSIFYMGLLTTPVNLFVFYLQDAWQLVPDEFFARLIMEILSITVIIIASVIMNRSSLWKNIIRDLPVRYYLIGFFISFAASGVGAFTGFAAEGMPLAMQVFYTTVGLVTEEFIYLFGVFLLYQRELRQRYQKESALKDELLKKSEKYYLSLERNEREVRKIRHDIKKHLSVLASCLEQNDKDKALQYLDEINIRVPDKRNIPVDVGNDLVNAVIENEKSQMSEDIIVQCNGLLPRPLDMESFDLCTIFSNLLSNAREACEMLRESEKRVVLDIGGKQGHLDLTIRNPIEWDVDTKQIGKFTSKGDKKNHGLGLLNVIETVEKHNGTIYFSVEQQEFVVHIFI